MFRLFDTLGRILRNPDPNGDGSGGEGGEGGGESSSWISTLPEEMRATIPEEITKDPNITKYKDTTEFLKGHVNLAKKIGEKGVIIPKEGAAPEEMEKFYNSLGRPEKPELYKLGTVEGLHESIKSTPESTAAFQALSHKLGLTQGQADGINKTLMQAVNQVVIQHEKKQQEAMQTTEAALRQEWGDKFDANKSIVGKVALQVLGEEGIKSLGGAEGLGNNPQFNKLIYKLASQLSEDSMKNISSGTKTGQGGSVSPEQAIAEIKKIENDKDSELSKAFWDEKHPQHKDVVKKRQELYAIAYPEGGE
jgi:hypothetical protein